MKRGETMMLALRWFLVLVVLSGAVSAPGAVLRVRWDSPGYTQDGSNWGMAFRTVQAAVDAARPGDEIWVAKGVYREAVVIPKEVHLYGGFQAWDTRFEERDPAARVTVLDATDKWASVIRITDEASGTVVDGFTIRGGAGTFSSDGYQWYRLGGGIYGEASAAISGNIFEANHLPETNGNGGAIFADGLSVVIERNIIRGNTSGRGASLHASGTGVIRNNLVADNAGGISAHGAIRVVNNTIIRNNSPGLIGSGPETGGAEWINNIVAYNRYGIVVDPATVSIRHNFVFGNLYTDYSQDAYGEKPFDLTGINGNTSRNPFVRSGDPLGRLAPRSPCIDAGEDTFWSGGLDLEGQARLQGAHVDIGADEFDFSAPIPPPLTRAYVRPDGDDISDGASWATAMRSVAAGISAVEELHGEVWVAGGTYDEGPVILNGVSVYGGFAGTETSRDRSDPAAHPTVLAEGANGTSIRVRPSERPVTVDGMTVNGDIQISGVETAITRCVLNGGALSGSGAPITVTDTLIDTDHKGLAVQLTNATVDFRRNTVRNGAAFAASWGWPQMWIGVSGAGLVCNRVTGIIADNLIHSNSNGAMGTDHATAEGAGVSLYNCDVEVTRNRITGNVSWAAGEFSAAVVGVGLSVYGGHVRIENNVISENCGATDGLFSGGGGNGVGVSLSNTDALLLNNVITGNKANDPASAVHVNGQAGGAFAIANNIIAFNDGGVSAYQATPSIRNNDVFGNVGKHPMEVAVTPGVNGNIAADPRFVDRAGGDYHIRLDSPCREAGTNAYLRPGDTDIDGDPRWLGLRVDIGVDELTYRMRRPERKRRQ